MTADTAPASPAGAEADGVQHRRATVRPDKSESVAELVEAFRSSSAAVLTEYRGLSVKQLTALRVALGVAWATLVASELIAAQQGLGALIQNASAYFLLDVIYVGIICIGLIALVMDLVLRRVSARLVAWQERI